MSTDADTQPQTASEPQLEDAASTIQLVLQEAKHAQGIELLPLPASVREALGLPPVRQLSPIELVQRAFAAR